MKQFAKVSIITIVAYVAVIAATYFFLADALIGFYAGRVQTCGATIHPVASDCGTQAAPYIAIMIGVLAALLNWILLLLARRPLSAITALITALVLEGFIWGFVRQVHPEYSVILAGLVLLLGGVPGGLDHAFAWMRRDTSK